MDFNGSIRCVFFKVPLDPLDPMDSNRHVKNELFYNGSTNRTISSLLEPMVPLKNKFLLTHLLIVL